MSKILIVGDLHGRKQTLDVFTEVLDKCAKIATKCDLTVFLGDINDTKANIRSEVQRVLVDKLSNWPGPSIVLTGNHDYDSAIECEGHSLEVLDLIESTYRIDVISKPTLQNNMMFVPYLPEERFLQVKLEDANICFLHQDIQKAKYSNLMEVPSKIKSEMFKHYKRVFVGHIHMQQEFDNIIYVGTPYTESFKESNENKRVIIYDTDTDKILDIPLGIRQHVTFEYTINQLDDIKDIKIDLKTKIKPNHIIRVVINVPEEIESKVKKALFSDLNIETLKTNKITNVTKKIQVTESMTNLEMMNIYLQQLDLNVEIRQKINSYNEEILLGIKQ